MKHNKHIRVDTLINRMHIIQDRFPPNIDRQDETRIVRWEIKIKEKTKDE